MGFILQWIDAIWIPLVLVGVHKAQRWWGLGFVLLCMVMMRLQVDLMQSIGHPFGILQLLPFHVFTKGQIVYSIFYALYIILAHYSPNTNGFIFMAASISMFFMALTVSMIVMLL